MLHIITGPTCSGKNTWVKKHMTNIKQLVTYTTRPIRNNEPKDSYHFINKEQAKLIADNKKVAKTTHNNYEYFIHTDDLINQTDIEQYIILDPSGVKDIDAIGIPYYLTILSCSFETRKNRFIQRQKISNEDAIFLFTERCKTEINAFDDMLYAISNNALKPKKIQKVITD